MRYLFLFLLSFSLSHAEKIAFFYALEEDLKGFRAEVGEALRSFSVGETSVQEFSLNGHKIYAVKMGSGCVQTATSAQALLARTRCDQAISLGPVGGIDEKAKIEKWYFVSKIIAWQRGSQKATQFIQHEKATWSFPPSKVPLPPLWKNSEKIAVASGEVFIASNSLRGEIASKTNCAAVDMNLFGLLTVLDSHKIPSQHFRIVSDYADEKASDDFRSFVSKYKGEGGKTLAHMIRSLPEDKTSPESHKGLQRLFNNVPSPSSPRASQPEE